MPTTQRLLTQWFLTSTERGNPSTGLDARHLGGAPWTEGNMVRPLIHGATYFAELHRRVSQMRDGDLLMFVDWRGDPDERLTGSPDTEVGKVFAAAARRGVDVRGLVWRSHWDRLAFSAAENRRLGDEINDAGGQCLLDMRVRTGGSHHQKIVEAITHTAVYCGFPKALNAIFVAKRVFAQRDLLPVNAPAA